MSKFNSISLLLSLFVTHCCSMFISVSLPFLPRSSAGLEAAQDADLEEVVADVAKHSQRNLVDGRERETNFLLVEVLRHPEGNQVNPSDHGWHVVEVSCGRLTQG